MTDRKDKKVPVQFFVSKADRKKLRIMAAKTGKTIQEIAADLMSNALNKK